MLSSDVVIVGGGLGGMLAAKTARENGASVILIDKARAATSGPTAFAAGDFLAWIAEEDCLDDWVNYYLEVGEGINSRNWITRLFEINYNLIKEFDSEGFYIEKDSSGSYLRRGGRGRITKCVLIPAYQLMKDLRKRVITRGVKIIDRIQITEVLKTPDNEINGVVGFDKRSGETFKLNCKAVVLAAGGCSYRGPFFGQDVVAGEGLYMAYKAGAKLAYMEYGNHFNVSLKKFDTYGQSKFMAHGGKYINHRGEDFLNITGEGSRASGHVAVRRMVEQVKEGKGPIYLDLRAFNEQELVKKLMPNLAMLLEASDIDFYKTPNEVIPALTGTSNASSAGVLIDENAETSIKGLFAAGDNASKGLVTGACVGLSGISLAWANVTGYLAGKNAAQIAKNKKSQALDIIDETKQFEPLRNTGEYKPREIIWNLSGLMGNGFVTILKSKDRLLKAKAKLDNLLDQLTKNTRVEDYQDLMIWNEAKSSINTAYLTIEASIVREETRGGHFREDFPEKNSELARILESSISSKPEFKEIREG